MSTFVSEQHGGFAIFYEEMSKSHILNLAYIYAEHLLPFPYLQFITDREYVS